MKLPKVVKRETKDGTDPVHHVAPNSHHLTQSVNERTVKNLENAKVEIRGERIDKSSVKPEGDVASVYRPPSPPSTPPVSPPSTPPRLPLTSRTHRRAASEELRMTDVSLSHILLLLPNDSDSNIASPAALMEHMESRPGEFALQNRQKVFSSLLHYSLFVFNEQTDSASFPLVLRTINSFTPDEHASATHNSEDILSKMAAIMLRHVHEEEFKKLQEQKGVTIQEFGKLQVEVQEHRERIARLEAWKAEHLSLEYLSYHRIKDLTVENSQFEAELVKKRKEAEVARNAITSLRHHHRTSAIDSKKEHEQAMIQIEGELFDAEEKYRNLEAEVRFLEHRREEEKLGVVYTEDNDVESWQARLEESMIANEELEKENSDVLFEKSTLEHRFDNQQLLVDDLQTTVASCEHRIAQLEEEVARLRIDLISTNSEVDKANKVAEAKQAETTKMKSSIKKLETDNVSLRASVTGLNASTAALGKQNAKLMSSVDAINLRSFLDRLILGMAVVGRIVASGQGVSLFRQRMSLSDFLWDGKKFPSRFIDVLCRCAVTLEHKRRIGKLTTEEEGFATLFGSDEEICEVYDFVMSDASWTRLFGNLSAHPELEKFDKLHEMVTQSVHKEERPVATHCVAAFMCLYPDDGANKRAEMARISREKSKVWGFRSNTATEKRHTCILECLAYYRDVGEDEFPYSKPPMF